MAACIAARSLAEELKELIGLSEDHQQVIIDQEFLRILRQDEAAAVQAGLTAETEVQEPIAAGEFLLRIKDASKEHAAAIRALIRDNSPALVNSEWQEKEQVNEDGQGVELYAPLHDNLYQASGWRCSPSRLRRSGLRLACGSTDSAELVALPSNRLPRTVRGAARR